MLLYFCPTVPTCQSGYIAFNGSCYIHGTVASVWAQGVDDCHVDGTSAFVPSNAEEMAYLLSVAGRFLFAVDQVDHRDLMIIRRLNEVFLRGHLHHRFSCDHNFGPPDLWKRQHLWSSNTLPQLGIEPGPWRGQTGCCMALRMGTMYWNHDILWLAGQFAEIIEAALSQTLFEGSHIMGAFFA